MSLPMAYPLQTPHQQWHTRSHRPTRAAGPTQVAHDGHHWWIHHACGQSGTQTVYKLMETNSGLNINDCPNLTTLPRFFTAICQVLRQTPYNRPFTEDRLKVPERLGLELRLLFACSLPCLILSSTVWWIAPSPQELACHSADPKGCWLLAVWTLSCFLWMLSWFTSFWSTAVLCPQRGHTYLTQSPPPPTVCPHS